MNLHLSNYRIFQHTSVTFSDTKRTEKNGLYLLFLHSVHNDFEEQIEQLYQSLPNHEKFTNI